MNIKWERDRGILTLENEMIVVSNIVRNELNGWRHSNEVVMTVPSGVDIAMPYQPRKFPKGTWRVTKVVPTRNPEYAPYFIRTDAWQMVEVWNVETNPDTGRKEYKNKSGEKVKDTGYGLHHAKFYSGVRWVDSNTTLGCGNIAKESDAEWLAERIDIALNKGEEVILEVV